MWNLDLQAAEAGQAIVGATKTENIKQVNELQAQLSKSLGVLQESGVYALLMYLLAKRKKDGDKSGDPFHVILNQLLEAVIKNKVGLGLEDNEVLPRSDNRRYHSNEVLEWAQKMILSDLYRLLLLRDFFQRALTYARYAAEALEVELKDQNNEVKSGTPAPESGGSP